MTENTTSATELHPGTPASDFNAAAFIITMVAIVMSFVFVLLMGNVFDKWVQDVKEKKLGFGKNAVVSPMAMKKRLGLHLKKRVEASGEVEAVEARKFSRP